MGQVIKMPGVPFSPLILTHDFVRRLAALNAARRQLKKWGFRIISETTHSRCSDFAWYPEIRIDKEATPTLYPLRSEALSRGFRRLDNDQSGGRGEMETGNYEYQGVIVSWEVKKV